MNTGYQLASSTGSSYPISTEGLSIGRSHTNNILIPDPSVSRLHARILYAGGRFWIRDENSMLGIYVNRVRVQGQQELRPGDILQIGSESFSLIPMTRAINPPVSAPSRQVRETRPLFVLIGGVVLLAVVAVIALAIPGNVSKPSIVTNTASAIIASPLVNTATRTVTATSTSTKTPTEVPSPTSTPKPTVVVNVPTLNVREGPGADYTIIGSAKQGDELVVVGQANNCEWLKVILANGASGWVSKQRVSFSLSCSAIPLASYPTPPPTRILKTPTPVCATTAYLDITNDTGGTVTLYLYGPADFTFYLSPGSNTLAVCPGTYSYTAYGCGGSKDTGSMTAGEAHRFYCSP